MKTIHNKSVISVRNNNNNNSYHVILNNINKINIINSPEIENRILPLIKENETRVFLNLTDVNFIDSTGFNTLLKIQRTAFLKNVELIIENVKEEVLELFDLLGLNNEFEIHNSGPYYSNLKKAS